MSRLASGSRLPDLLHQAIAPEVLTSCCDFPLQDLPETVLKKRQAPHLAQKSSRQLTPCLRQCCSEQFMWPVLISLPHPASPTPLILLLSLASNTKQIFPITLALHVSPLHQVFLAASHFPSCRLTSHPSHPSVPFVRVGSGCWQLGCSACSTSRFCSPPSYEKEGGRK